MEPILSDRQKADQTALTVESTARCQRRRLAALSQSKAPTLSLVYRGEGTYEVVQASQQVIDTSSGEAGGQAPPPPTPPDSTSRSYPKAPTPTPVYKAEGGYGVVQASHKVIQQPPPEPPSKPYLPQLVTYKS